MERKESTTMRILGSTWWVITEILRAIALRIPASGKTVARESYRTIRNISIVIVIVFTITCLLLGAGQVADRAAPVLSATYKSYRQPPAETPSAVENLWSSIQKIAD